MKKPRRSGGSSSSFGKPARSGSSGKPRSSGGLSGMFSRKVRGGGGKPSRPMPGGPKKRHREEARKTRDGFVKPPNDPGPKSAEEIAAGYGQPAPVEDGGGYGGGGGGCCSSISSLMTIIVIGVIVVTVIFVLRCTSC